MQSPEALHHPGHEALLLLAASALSVTACPLCHTETGAKVRATVLENHFWFNASATLLPFVFFSGVTACLYFGLPNILDPDEKP